MHCFFKMSARVSLLQLLCMGSTTSLKLLSRMLNVQTRAFVSEDKAQPSAPANHAPLAAEVAWPR